ncbi:neural cell adhesion molecule L1.2 isoform X1 [Engraulis encrasicolus]
MHYLSARTMFSKEPITLVVSDTVARKRRPQMLRPTGSRSSYHVLRGQTLQLECIVQGLPTPSVRWVKKDSVMSETRVTRRNSNTLLHLSDVQKADEGQYQCTANNSQGTVTHVYNVVVEAAPYWRVKPVSQLYAPGEDVKLDCEADGIPTPQVSWSMNGSPLPEVDPDPRRIVKAGVLLLKNVDFYDTAVFQCKATNKHGSIVVNTYVYVIELPPQILTPTGQTYRVVEGGLTSLECRSFGSPMPQVSWESEDQTSVMSSSRVSQLIGGALHITNVTHDDGGLYTCSVTSANASITAELDVFDKTVITLPPSELRVQRGNVSVFTCVAQVDRRLEYELQWRKDGAKLDDSAEDDKYTFEGPELRVADVQDEDQGVYTCDVITVLDNAEASGSITIVDVPDPPNQPQVTNKKDRSVTLTWSPGEDNNSPITGYIVEVEVTGVETDDWMEWRRIVGNEQQAVLSLRPFLSYRFRVIAINDVGMSRPSQASDPHSTLAAPPDSNPVGVKSESVDPDQLVITWDEMDQQSFNGPAFQYKVMWRRVVGAGPAWSSNFSSSPPYVVTGVGNFTAFDIKVQAVNELGLAPDPVPAIGYSGEDVPLAPPMDPAVEVLNSTAIKVKWFPIAMETVRGHLLGYKIHLWHIGPMNVPHHHKDPGQHVHHQPPGITLSTGPTETHKVVADLQPYSKYVLRATVFNSKGEGVGSEPLLIHMPEGVPSPPADLELVSPSETEMTLHWKPPAQPNGLLTGYLVQYQQISETDYSPVQVVSIENPKITNMTINRLDPRSRYRFHVRGRTSKGEGKPITKEGATMLDGSPPAFINVSVGETLLNLSWASQERQRSVGFYLEYLRKGGWGKWVRSEKLDSSLSFYQLQGLQPGSEYRLRATYNNTSFWDTEVHTEGAGVMQVQAGFATEGWFIGLVSAVALLVLLLLILCFIRRSKGGKYSVKDKEEGHIDSEARPMKDETFGEYRSDNDDKHTASQPSLCDDSKLCSEDGLGLGDYGNSHSHSVQTEVIMDESLASQYSAATNATGNGNGTGVGGNGNGIGGVGLGLGVGGVGGIIMRDGGCGPESLEAPSGDVSPPPLQPPPYSPSPAFS